MAAAIDDGVLTHDCFLDAVNGHWTEVENPVKKTIFARVPPAADPDVEVEAVTEGVIAAVRLTGQGQSCTAGSSLLVHAEVAGAVIDQRVVRLRTLRVGAPLDEATDAGSLVDEKQFLRVRTYVEEALTRPQVSTWRTEGDAIAQANDSEYALARFVRTAARTGTSDRRCTRSRLGTQELCRRSGTPTAARRCRDEPPRPSSHSRACLIAEPPSNRSPSLLHENPWAVFRLG